MREWQRRRDRNGWFIGGKLLDVMPHVIKVPLRGHYSAWAATARVWNEEQQLCREWIVANLSKDNLYYMGPGPKFTRYYFEDSRDAVMFKLAWGGK